MKIAIIDDIEAERQRLSDFILCYKEETNACIEIENFDSGETFLSSFSPGVFDIVFLDIFMKQLDGMETAKQIRKQDETCLLIFASSSDSFAIQSFRVRAFDYLLKPYDYDQFVEIMRLCDQTLGRQSHFIQIKEGREMVKIRLKDIIYTDYSNHYIQIHTKKRLIKSYLPFNEFAPLLLTHSSFLCCYRNCIINMDAVDVLDITDFVLINGERLPISRSNRNQIRQKYADYVFEQLERGM